MHTYPLKAPKLAAINAALNEGQERQAARASSSGKAAAQARVVTPLGEVVFKGHSAYDLAAQLQLGIRCVLLNGLSSKKKQRLKLHMSFATIKQASAGASWLSSWLSTFL
jgi:hypothetical protein